MNRTAAVAQGSTSRILAVRISPGKDVIETLAEVCLDNRITAGTVDVLIGGANSAKLIVPITDPTSPSGVAAKEINVPHPVAFTAGQGMVCTRENGEIEIHLHVTLADDTRLYGGDLVKGSAIVTTTADAIISRVDDVTFLRKFDPEVGFVVFHPSANS